MTARMLGGGSGGASRVRNERELPVKVDIPAGPDNPAGTIRTVDLRLVTNRTALSLVRKRHQEGAHPDVRNSPGVTGCLACTAIAVRMFELTRDIED